MIATFPVRAVGLTNARDIPLNRGGASTVQNVETVLFGVLEPITFGVVTQVKDPETFEVQDATKFIPTMGSVQPLKVRELSIKREGERAWTWLKILALPDLFLRPNDVVRIDGILGIDPGSKWRVMGNKPWTAKGYMYYEVVADYQVPPGYAGYANEPAVS